MKLLCIHFIKIRMVSKLPFSFNEHSKIIYENGLIINKIMRNK